MKSINVEVGGLVSSLSAEGVRRKLLQLPGVHHADVNYVAGSATVHLDEGQLSVEDLRQRIAECGYHCRGEQTPKHVCAPAAGVSADPSHAVHGHHGAPARQAQEMGHEGHHAHAPATAARAKAAATTPAAHAAHQAHAGDPAMDDMMHDMGHGSGSMQDMARDMRNRFFVALVFAIPVFFYSPMGKMFGDFQTPFGLDDKLFLFFLASAAIIYPGWPFYVAAWRALRNGVANMATLVVLSVGTGYLFSIGATFFYEGEVFYEAASGCWSSSCWGTGWRCAPARAHPTRFAR